MFITYIKVVMIMLKLFGIIFFIGYLFMSQIGFRAIKIDDLIDTNIKVTVKGAVLAEKTYELPAFSDLDYLLAQITLDDDADISMLNPNITLKNNDVIDIPYKQEKELISINSGTYEQLITLKGIKDKTALAIIAYRNENGLFQTIEELMNVKGIGIKKFTDIKADIKL